VPQRREQSHKSSSYRKNFTFLDQINNQRQVLGDTGVLEFQYTQILQFDVCRRLFSIIEGKNKSRQYPIIKILCNGVKEQKMKNNLS
jgi:hypothetical protein